VQPEVSQRYAATRGGFMEKAPLQAAHSKLFHGLAMIRHPLLMPFRKFSVRE
jgi:hypothetical protein